MAPSPWSIGGAAAAAPSAATVARIVVPAPGEGCSVDMRAPSSAASSSLVVAIGGKGPTARCPSRPCTSGCANGSLSICTLKKCICCDALPGRSNEEKWAALKAVGSSIRGSGWALSGPDSSWECRAAQSRQARPEEAQEPSGGTAKGRTLTVLAHARDGAVAAARQPEAHRARLRQHLAHDARRRVLQQRVARLVGEEGKVPSGAHLVRVRVRGQWSGLGLGLGSAANPHPNP